STHTGARYWKKRLANLVDFPPRAEVLRFIQTTAMEAMHSVEAELEERGWVAEVSFDEQNYRAHFEVFREGQLEFVYEIRLRGYDMPEFITQEDENAPEDQLYYRAEVFLRRGGQAYDVYGYDRQDIISDILDQFEKYMHFLHVSPGILPWRMEAHDDDLQNDEEDLEYDEGTTDDRDVTGADVGDAQDAATTKQNEKGTQDAHPQTNDDKTS